MAGWDFDCAEYGRRIVSKRTGEEIEPDTAVCYNSYSENGKTGIHYTYPGFGGSEDFKAAVSQRELAKKLNQTPPSVTTAIQKMEKLGYITRTPDSEDQRILRLRLTDKSREYLEHIREATQKIEEHILKGMNIEEKLLFRRLLMQVRDNLLEETDTDFLKSHMKL